MRATVELYYSQEIEIDLTDYGHDEDIKFEELTEDEQNEITDALREQVIVSCYVKTIMED